jgi:hypothetical protein
MISHRIILIFYTGIMMQQIIVLIINYSTFETIMRFEVQKIKFLPMIQIDKRTNMANLDKLIKIYPEMEQDRILIKNQSSKIGLNEYKESELLRINYDKYLSKLLSDNKLNEIHKIAETNRIMKLCYFEFEFKTINCSKIEAGISSGKYNFHAINLLNYSKDDFEPEIDMNKLRRITIKYHQFENGQLIMTLFKYHSVFISRSALDLEMNARTKLIYSAYTIKKINSPRYKCISNENVEHFGEEYFDFCKIDCIARLLNQTFSCLTIRNKYLVRYFKRDLVKNYYKICDYSVLANSSLLQRIWDECVKECPEKCDSINFDTKIEVIEKGLKETIVEIIPSHSPRIVYKETLNTDINRLIYNCGGILGLWFGLTPVNITDLLLKTSQLYIFIRYLISFLIQRIKGFSSRISLFLINSFQLLLSFILLLKNSLLLAVEWIKILINLAINFLKIIFLIIIFKCKELYLVFCKLIASLFRFVHFLVFVL